jgi:bifunctional NMN adenylyltransferase/nudix hydrolase
MGQKFGVVVGRFQIDQLSDGHIALIDYVSNIHGVHNVVIVVGCPRTPTNPTNPLDFTARAAMLHEAYPEASVIPLSDHRENTDWSKNLDSLIDSIAGLQGAKLYSGRDGFIPHYSGKFETELLDLNIECSATERRDEIKKHPNLFSVEFRRGAIWAHQNRAHQTYETVDIALVRKQDDETYILLGKKPGETKWRFPGGFVDPGETFAQAARRELKEETGVETESQFTIIGDFILDEWRIRRQKGVSHRTVLCFAIHTWGAAKAGDDLAHVEWIPVKDVIDANAMVDEHKELMLKGVVSHLELNEALFALAGAVKSAILNPSSSLHSPPKITV